MGGGRSKRRRGAACLGINVYDTLWPRRIDRNQGTVRRERSNTGGWKGEILEKIGIAMDSELLVTHPQTEEVHKGNRRRKRYNPT